jgi:hypothetical protein
VSSTVALSTATTSTTTTTTTTNQKLKNTTAARFWLTYWTIYSILFILMDYVENFCGHIRGFYTLCACATLYLFLPMFQGADVVFRRILVPLSGQYENMLLHDAYLVKVGMEESLPVAERARVMALAANVFKQKSN